ncbi:MAG: NADH-quinone oxidoreductase subunit N [Deltaproteobacteria bacterium]|nr:NADH-quinone oxidoreductase subunit N [Deltaproteobacteria bacterium]
MIFSVQWVLPELYLLLLIIALFIQAVLHRYLLPPPEKWLPWAAALGILITLFSLNQKGLIGFGSYRLDALSQFFKLTVITGLTFSVGIAARQPTLNRDKRTEYLLFMALSAWGLMLLSSTVELISIFLAMELSTFSLLPLIPVRNEEKGAAKAAIRYVFFSAAATAIGLFGLSYILATQHTTYLHLMVPALWRWTSSPLAVTGLMLFLCATLFKLALFPFQAWAPDVYEGASNETAAYISTLPKLGAAVVLIRIAAMLRPGLEINTILACLTAVSMTYGNLAALSQTDIKRLLGYSTVAHAGYMILGLVAGTAEGLAATAFYAFVYMLMNFTCFWVISKAAPDGRNLKLDDLDGLHTRSPSLALILSVGALALAGFPPTAGFMGKLFLLSALWTHEYNWLVILAAGNMAVAFFYYLNLIRHAYTRHPREPSIEPAGLPVSTRLWGFLLAALIILLGIFPSPLFEFALRAGRQLMPF